MPRDVDAGLDDERLADPVLDDQVAQLLGPAGIREEVVVAEEHDVGRDRLELLDDRFDRPLRVLPLLPERIEAERAELALERAAPRCQDRVERVTAEPDAVLSASSTRAVAETGPDRRCAPVGQDLVLVVHDPPVPPVGEPANVLVRDARDDLPDDLLALAAYDHVDVRTSLEQVLDLLRRLVAPDDRGDLIGQLRDELADPLEPGLPAHADAHQIDLAADERAERLRVAGRPSRSEGRGASPCRRGPSWLAAMYSSPVGGNRPLVSAAWPKYGLSVKHVCIGLLHLTS